MSLKFYRTEFPTELRKRIMAGDPEVTCQEPYRVAPHVWMVSGHVDQSDFLIDTGDGLILIDTPVPAWEKYLFESIRKVGYDPKDIKLLLISHEHFDHDGCAAAIKAASGCKIMMSEQAWYAKTHFVERAGSTMGKYPQSPYYEPDEFYADDKPITLGKFTIRTKWTPGHAPGVTSFFFDDTDDETGKTYHVAMHGGMGIDAMRPDRCGYPGYATKEQRDMFIDQCYEMAMYDVDITLASHSNQGNINANIPEDRNDYSVFVDPRAWPVILLERRARIMEFRCGGNTVYGDEKFNPVNIPKEEGK